MPLKPKWAEPPSKAMSNVPIQSEAKTANPEGAPKSEKKNSTKPTPVKRTTLALAERKDQKSKTLQTADEKSSKGSLSHQKQTNKSLSPILGTRTDQLN